MAKASRLTGILTRENAQPLIEFAVNHTTRETDNEVARLREAAKASGLGSACADRAKRHKLEISGAVLDLIKRAQSRVASLERKLVDLDRVLSQMLNDYLDRVDPVRKAERAQKRTQQRAQRNAHERRETEECETGQCVPDERTKNSVQTELPAKAQPEPRSDLCSESRAQASGTPRSATPAGPARECASVSKSTSTSTSTRVSRTVPAEARVEVRAGARASSSAGATSANSVRATTSRSGRKPLTAQQKHAVFARDGGRCTFQDLTGNRCPNQSWLHLYHIHPVNLGGGNDPSNLTTLCAFHHERAFRSKARSLGCVSDRQLIVEVSRVWGTFGLGRPQLGGSLEFRNLAKIPHKGARSRMRQL